MTFRIESPAFDQGKDIPRRHTCEGEDISPPLRWRDVPEGTRSLFLLCEDPDAPTGVFRHWAVYNIPPDRGSLPEGLAPDDPSLPQPVNDFGRRGYGGACPPRGHGIHHYHFRLLALDTPTLEVGAAATCLEAFTLAKPHVLAQAETIGTFAR